MTRPRYTKGEAVKFHPDAWDRFEQAIKAISKAKPKHRRAKTKSAKRVAS